MLVDWLWFRSLGYGAVFVTVWDGAQSRRSQMVAIASWLLLAGNGLLAARATGPAVRRLRLVRGGGDPAGLPETLEISLERFPWRAVVLGAASC